MNAYAQMGRLLAQGWYPVALPTDTGVLIAAAQPKTLEHVAALLHPDARERARFLIGFAVGTHEQVTHG